MKGYLQKDILAQAKARELEIMRGKTTFEDITKQVYESNGIGGSKQQTPRSPRDQALQLFGSYEPDKYEYGTNPQTGKFARRPKGK